LARQVRKAILNKTITIYNPDAFFNNAVWLDDLVDFIEQLIRDNYNNDQLFLLGAKKELSIRTITELIRNRAQSQSKIKKEEGKPSYTLEILNAITAGYQPLKMKNMLINQIDFTLAKRRLSCP